MKTRLYHRVNMAFAKTLPEQRIFLKSDSGTRFMRLRPVQSAAFIAGATLLMGWTVVVTAIFLMDTISAGNAREEAQRERAIYEARLNALSAERDNRAQEAATAQDRFYVALEQISQMQSALLASEDARLEAETGIGVVQGTLRDVIRERDAARTQVAALRAQIEEGENAVAPELAQARALEGSVSFLTSALQDTATERDLATKLAAEAEEVAEDLQFTLDLKQENNDAIFRKLEEAVTVSLEPLDKMFRAAGMPTDSILREVRRGQNTAGASVLPSAASTSGSGASDAEIIEESTNRANTILRELDRINLYRIAAEKTPVAMPVKTAHRFTSPFGYRRDPKGAGRKMHNGVDFAGRTGTPIYATADGVVTHAGWQSGYGKLVKIRHAFGIETRYAHNSKIKVKVGQRVSRGDRIGDMGATGRVTGTHLHYEVRLNGKAIDPMTYIKAGRDVF